MRLERKLGARIEAVAETSYTKVNVSKVPGGVGPVQLVDNFRGLTYKGEVTVKASSRLLGKASVRREIVPTILQGRGYEIQTTYGGGLTYRIGTRLALDLAGEEQRKNIREGLAPVPLNSITDSRLRTGSAALRYKQSARLSFTLNGQLEERKADDPQFNYTSERVGLSADLSF